MIKERISSVPETFLPPRNSSQQVLNVITVAVAILSVLIFFIGLGNTGIMDPSDGFYAEAGREMLESGNFLTPYLNYETYFDKPILIYWLTAASLKLFGINTFASRLPSALSAVLLVVMLFRFCVARLSLRTALLVTMILLSCPLFLILGRVSLIDMPLTLVITFALLNFFEALNNSSRRNLALGYIAVGLGLLLKGPVAIVLVALPVVIYLFVQEMDGKKTLLAIARLKPLFGLLIVLAIAAPWYVMEGFATKGEFLRYFFLEQNLARAAGKLKLSHTQPLWFFVPILAVGILPWVSFVPIQMHRIFNRLRKRRSWLLARNKLRLFCLIWAASTFVFFSLISSKLPTYILPMIPAVALALGIQLEEELRASRTSILKWCGIMTLFVTAVVLVVYSSKFALEPMWIYSIGAAVILMSSFWLWARARGFGLTAGVYSFGLFAVFFFATLMPSLIQEFYSSHQGDYAYLLNEAHARNYNLAEIQFEHPSASFCMKKKVPVLMNYYDFAAFLALPPKGHAILCSKQYVPLVKEIPYYKEIDHRGKQYLFVAEDEKKMMLQHFYNMQQRASR